MSDWDESLHPRATDGKFGAGSGHAGKEALGKAMAAKGAKARGARAAKSPVLPGAPMPAAAAAAPKAKKPRAKFDATEHDKAIAAAKTKEALIRMHSIKVKEHMAAAKANAKTAKSKEEKAKHKETFSKLSARRDELKTAAAGAKKERIDAGKAKTAARAEYTAGRKAEREKAAAAKAKAKADKAPAGKKKSAGAGPAAKAAGAPPSAAKKPDGSAGPSSPKPAPVAGAPKTEPAPSPKAAAPKAATPQSPAASNKEPSGATPLSQEEFSAMAKTDREKLSPEEHKAMLSYSDAGLYGQLNNKFRAFHSEDKAYLRERFKSAFEAHDDNLKPIISALDAGIAKSSMPKDTVVYRGVNGMAGSSSGKVDLASLKPGDEFVDHGYVSTSMDKGILSDYVKGMGVRQGAELHITIPKGGQGFAIPSKFDKEKELLLPRGSKFKVTKVEQSPNGGHPIVHVTVDGVHRPGE